MIRAITIVASVLSLAACTESEPVPGSSDLVVIGKCSFGPANRTTIEPGDVFLYAVVDPERAYSIVTGTAEHAEPLVERTMAQPVTSLIPARMTGAKWFDFGDEGHFIGFEWGGQIHTAIGTTYDTPNAYPACAAWNEPTP